MGKGLKDIAQDLKDANKKVQLIYAFNGTGKTRLSREFKELVAPKSDSDEEVGLAREKILYYSALTEDLFYWDNDLKSDSENDAEPKLKIQRNTFTNWILQDRGQDQNIVENFQRYSNDRITPNFSPQIEQFTNADGKRENRTTYPDVEFSLDSGTVSTGSIKISKGEERTFIWSMFYTQLQEVVSILAEPVPEKRDDNQFDSLEYVFVDDPVSSLDEAHLIELAVDIATLVKDSVPDGTGSPGNPRDLGVRFIITTHSPLFFHVLCNELGRDDKSRASKWKRDWFSKSLLEKLEDGSLRLASQSDDSPFAYHLYLLQELKKVIESGQVKKYHFNLLRNILEKTATFLGYNDWANLLPESDDGSPDRYAKRIINLSSHSKHSAEEVPVLEQKDKSDLENLIKHIVSNSNFHSRYRPNEQDG